MLTLLGLCAIAAAITIAVMFYSVATFEGDEEQGGFRPRKTFSEVLWLLVPVAIFVSAALPAVGAMLAAR